MFLKRKTTHKYAQSIDFLILGIIHQQPLCRHPLHF